MKTHKEALVKKLKRKKYRDAYTEWNLKTGLACQIYSLRKTLGLTQEEFAEKIKTSQQVVSRIESDDYGKMTLGSLIKIAKGLDIGLLVKFVPFSEVVNDSVRDSNEILKASNILSEDQIIPLDN